ncbi:hypothetical protein CEXT_264851 [Caerostris extrusa]|uniref:Uncharacterized protein n=1 Tax=Caerostris extrusa TaxID=172846 RepID=A0AAV4WY55_CAEEX|nr:hypothetical protein CEXT_264851 [Caerostris extrusa]
MNQISDFVSDKSMSEGLLSQYYRSEAAAAVAVRPDSFICLWRTSHRLLIALELGGMQTIIGLIKPHALLFREGW